MSAAARNSIEIQAQIRHNSEQFRTTLSDLYGWEHEIKAKEAKLLQESQQTAPEAKLYEEAPPVRSHAAAMKQAEAELATKQTGTKEKNVDAGDNKVQPPEELHGSIEQRRIDANVLKDSGNRKVKIGEYERAIEEYSAAIELYADEAVFYTNRALCYLKLEHYESCIQDCEQAIELDSLAVKAYYRRMQANESLGNNMDALKDCTTVLTIDPKNIEAKRSLERINERLRKNAQGAFGPHFTPARNNLVDILPFDKPPYKRSNKALKRVPIADVVGPKDSKNYENSSLKITDDDIDKLFNSNCGPFVEVKRERAGESTAATTTTTSKASSTVNAVKQQPLEAATKETAKERERPKTSKLVKPTKEATPKEQVVPKQQQQMVQDTNRTTLTEAIAQPPIKPISPTAATAAMPAKAESELPTTKADLSLPPPPTCTAQFYTNWKELTPVQKYNYLKSIELPDLNKFLGAGFDSDTLTDILHILHDFYLLNHEESDAAAILLELNKHMYINILSLLMSGEDRKTLVDIVNKLKEHDSNVAHANLIALNFKLN